MVGRLRALLELAAGERGEPGRVLDPEGLELARGLATVADDDDVEAWWLVATLHGWRYGLLPDDRNQDDLTAAVDGYARLMLSARELVPEPMRELLAGWVGEHTGTSQTFGPDEAAELNNRAVRVLQDPYRAGDVAAVGRAIGWLRRAVALTPADHPDRAGRLSNLGLALRTRYGRTGATADLHEAAAACTTPPRPP
jgi:hypothetical protein